MLILNRKSFNSERNNLTVNSLFLECARVIFVLRNIFFYHRD